MNANKKIFKNAIFLYVLTFSNYFIGLMLFPYLSRVLSVEKFGLIGFSTSFCLVFQMFVEYGFQISTTAMISVNRDDKRRVSQIISTMTTAKAMLAVISLVVFLLCYWFVDTLHEHFRIVVLFYIDAIIKAFLPDAYFRGIEQMKAITVRTVFAKSGILISTLLLVKGNDGLLIYPISMIVCDAVALLWAYVLIYKEQIKWMGSTFGEIKMALKESFWFFVSRISVSINGSLGSIFLGLRFLPDSFEMGIYAGATRISTAGEQLIPPVGDALYPSMMKKKDYKLLYKMIFVVGSIWFLGCAMVYILATPLCILILGSQYALAGTCLRILVIGVFFGFFSFMFGYPALSPIGKATYANIAIMISACVNLIICTILWISNNITVFSVCIVFASSNIVVFAFRFISFMKFRHLAHITFSETKED